MPVLDICKGLFFFFYLPLLPVWWVITFTWERIINKYRRHERKKRYRAMKDKRTAEKEQYFLSVDQYTRGKIEMQILDIDKKTKAVKERTKYGGI